MEIAFIPGKENNEKEIIIYGASKYGDIAFYLLEYYGLKPKLYCDKALAGQKYHDINVIAPNQLYEYRDAIILVASADYYDEICDSLEEMGIQTIYTLAYMLENARLDVNKLHVRSRDIYQNRQNYIDVTIHRNKGLHFTRIQFVVTERCSLRCKDCTHLMQYYKSPKDLELTEYRAAFQRLIDVTDYISEVRILGGEPFMNPKMNQVIEWWHDNPKIGKITVYTNGTIIPSPDCLNSLTKEKVRVRVSNYKINSDRIQKLENVLKEQNIDYYVTDYEYWQDAGDLRFRNDSVEKMKHKFENCFERNCITFFRGQLHRCPRSAHAMNMKAMPVKREDFVDLRDDTKTDAELVEAIKRLQNMEWIEACNYCDGPNNHTQFIKPAVQVKEPRSFFESL